MQDHLAASGLLATAQGAAGTPRPAKGLLRVFTKRRDAVAPAPAPAPPEDADFEKQLQELSEETLKQKVPPAACSERSSRCTALTACTQTQKQKRHFLLRRRSLWWLWAPLLASLGLIVAAVILRILHPHAVRSHPPLLLLSAAQSRKLPTITEHRTKAAAAHHLLTPAVLQASLKGFGVWRWLFFAGAALCILARRL